MMCSLDGRIDCDMTEQIEDGTEYYTALASFNCPSQLMGRVTVQLHYASPEPFAAPAHSEPVGHEGVYVARQAEGYSVVLDSCGQLCYAESEIEGLPLLVAVAEDCSRAYLDYLESQGISWVATGRGRVDLARLVELLWSRFGVERLAVVGGGHVCGAFLSAGLVNEISVMVAPGVDGRSGMATVFDGISNPQAPPVRLKLLSVERVGRGTVWLRYQPEREVQ